MTPDIIKQKIQAATDEFDRLFAEGNAKRTEIEDIEKRLSELRGEFKALNSLLADPATTITAVEDKKKVKA